MSNIRPLERTDLAAVAALLDERLPGPAASGQMPDFLARSVIDHPWADEDIPSLVATDDEGEVVGFIGARVRRLNFGGKALRGVCCAHLVASADHRAGAAGALLLKRILSRGQDVTWSDQATNQVVRMWQLFGGGIDHSRACDWMLVVRPLRWIGSVAVDRARQRDIGRDRIPVGHALPEITRPARLRPDYDEAFLTDIFRQIEALRGGLVRRIVHRDGRPLGWYAYLVDRGVFRVIHLCAFEPNGEAVLAELVQHARAAGAAVVAGRLEPHLSWPLRRRIAVLGFARQPVIHARDPAVRAVLASDASLLTQLDGEWYQTVE